MEFTLQVECPHCDEETWESVEFDDSIWTPQGGGGYTTQKTQCHSCNKEYWFEASISIDVDFERSSKRKIK